MRRTHKAPVRGRAGNQVLCDSYSETALRTVDGYVERPVRGWGCRRDGLELVSESTVTGIRCFSHRSFGRSDELLWTRKWVAQHEASRSAEQGDYKQVKTHTSCSRAPLPVVAL